MSRLIILICYPPTHSRAHAPTQHPRAHAPQAKPENARKRTSKKVTGSLEQWQIRSRERRQAPDTAGDIVGRSGRWALEGWRCQTRGRVVTCSRVGAMEHWSHCGIAVEVWRWSRRRSTSRRGVDDGSPSRQTLTPSSAPFSVAQPLCPNTKNP